jgi:hypothetical protein
MQTQVLQMQTQVQNASADANAKNAVQMRITVHQEA